MRAILCSVAVMGMLTLSQPAAACALDGMYGSHRFNPFAGMDFGAGNPDSDSSSEWSDGQQDYNDDYEDYASEDTDQSVTDYNPEDL